MPNYRMLLQYDGTRYAGWQKQGNTDRTIQGKLETLLSRVCEETVEVAGAGRTDAGVHAYGQRASFSGEFGIPTDKLALAVNNWIAGAMKGKMATGPIRIKEVREMRRP